MKKALAALALATVSVSPAHADTAISSFTGGSQFTAFSSDETVGFVFTTLSNLSVTALGWYTPSGTVNASHQIGIWNSGGTLLGSATVSPGAPDGTGFRYVSLGAFSLAAGQQYFIGGRDLSGDGDNYVTSVSNLVTSPLITFNGSANSAAGSGFAFPSSINNISTGGRFGANFQFTDLGIAAVPEPATWAMLIIGFGFVGSTMRYGKRKTAVSFAR